MSVSNDGELSAALRRLRLWSSFVVPVTTAVFVTVNDGIIANNDAPFVHRPYAAEAMEQTTDPNPEFLRREEDPCYRHAYPYWKRIRSKKHQVHYLCEICHSGERLLSFIRCRHRWSVPAQQQPAGRKGHSIQS
jgi:hypothetical protein